jgi:class I fructose-bisphosphate aldolase
MNKRIREILGYYDSENAGVRSNLARMLNHGKLAGTGKFVILPVDQGFEHGPARSFAINPPAYDPRYHFQLAIDAGCNAFAAPLGLLEAGVAEFAGEIPLILKVNSHDVLNDEKDPAPSMTASVKDALRLGAAAVGLTIYPGSTQEKSMYQEARAIGEEAKANGLPLVIWSYPRGSGVSKQGETALDVVAYAAQIAAQLGANIIKVKPPTAFIEPFAARVKHVMQAAFDGRRIVIFSGGPKETDESLLGTVRGIQAGGGYGSIIGRNTFQRPKPEAIALLGKVIDIYKG